MLAQIFAIAIVLAACSGPTKVRYVGMAASQCPAGRPYQSPPAGNEVAVVTPPVRTAPVEEIAPRTAVEKAEPAAEVEDKPATKPTTKKNPKKKKKKKVRAVEDGE